MHWNFCAGLKVGVPQVSLSALCALHELLVACESRLVSAYGNIVTQAMTENMGRDVLFGDRMHLYSNPERVMARPVAFGNSSGQPFSGRIASQALKAFAVSFHNGRTRSRRPLPMT
jgi:hypothetical protein